MASPRACVVGLVQVERVDSGMVGLSSSRGGRPGLRGRDPLEVALGAAMLGSLWRQYQRLPVRPGPMTLGLVGTMVALHVFPEAAPPVGSVCLSSAVVWPLLVGVSARTGGSAWWGAVLSPLASLVGRPRGAWGRAEEVVRRLVGSALLHADPAHLYYNMAALLWKGTTLEAAMGTPRFATLVVYGVLASGVLAVALGRAAELAQVGTLPCTIGFSGVLYAMSVVMARSADARGVVRVGALGVTLPERYALWLDMALASLINPRISFLGHLGGAAAGALWCWASESAASWRRRRTPFPRGAAGRTTGRYP